MPARPSTQEVGRGGGLAASYTRTFTDSDSSLLSSRIWSSSDRNRLGPDSFSLIISTTVSLDAQNGTELPAKSRSTSHCCRYKSACLLRYVMGVEWALQWLALVRTWLWCAVIGSGAHVTMAATHTDRRRFLAFIERCRYSVNVVVVCRNGYFQHFVLVTGLWPTAFLHLRHYSKI